MAEETRGEAQMEDEAVVPSILRTAEWLVSRREDEDLALALDLLDRVRELLWAGAPAGQREAYVEISRAARAEAIRQGDSVVRFEAVDTLLRRGLVSPELASKLRAMPPESLRAAVGLIRDAARQQETGP